MCGIEVIPAITNRQHRKCRFPRNCTWGVWFWPESFWDMHPGFAKGDGIRARKCPALQYCRLPEYRLFRHPFVQRSRFISGTAFRHTHHTHGAKVQCRPCFHTSCRNPYFGFPEWHNGYLYHTDKTFPSFPNIFYPGCHSA